jgi:hypothetical protein
MSSANVRHPAEGAGKKPPAFPPYSLIASRSS